MQIVSSSESDKCYRCLYSFTHYRMIRLQEYEIRMGPVVQSVVSLTSSLRVISLTVLVDSIYNFLIFFAEKMWVAFALQKLLTFFSQKYQHICVSLDVNFNESLTNNIVSPWTEKWHSLYGPKFLYTWSGTNVIIFANSFLCTLTLYHTYSKVWWCDDVSYENVKR